MCCFRLVVVKGIYHYWRFVFSRRLKQIEVMASGFGETINDFLDVKGSFPLSWPLHA